MFNGKRLDLIEDEVGILRTNVTKLLQLAIEDKDLRNRTPPIGTGSVNNKKMIELLSKNSKLIAKVEQLTEENVELEKRARPKRKNHKAIIKRASNTKVTEAEKAMFLEMYDNDKTLLEMSTETGRSASCVSNWIKKLRPELVLDLEEEARHED